ncbi:type VII secretion system ESX-3 effector EsxQ [Mycobacterium tuberculosis]|uniref:type VII secretion system ESX-3 effector EsxQ n=1 Tax=Mycobacterium tuberculosis TaxID=1773 RepID=UPI00099AFD89|nr:type VII secretion system ESX-3 effector EsxQ [Mycobacterium tuberculosis]
MSQSMYSYPAMTANVGDMAGYTGTTQSLGADIASERTAPSRACQGDLGMSHQDWQAQWNQAMEALARAYRRCRRALRQIGVLERPVGDSSDCGTIRVGSFRGRWLDPRHAGPATDPGTTPP